MKKQTKNEKKNAHKFMIYKFVHALNNCYLLKFQKLKLKTYKIKNNNNNLTLININK